MNEDKGIVGTISAIILVLAVLGCLFLLLVDASGCALLPGHGIADSMADAAKQKPSGGVSVNELVAVAVLAVAAGVAATAFGLRAIGLPVVAGGIVTLVLSLTIAKYGSLIALVGLLVLLGALAAILFSRLKTHETAFAEVVAGAQKIKEKMVETAGPVGKTVANMILSSEQKHAATQQLVQVAKKKLGL